MYCFCSLSLWELVFFEFIVFARITRLKVTRSVIMVCNGHVANLISNFGPDLSTGRNWRQLAQSPINHCGNDETTEEVKVIDVRGCNRHLVANSSSKHPDINKNT